MIAKDSEMNKDKVESIRAQAANGAQEAVQQAKDAVAAGAASAAGAAKEAFENVTSKELNDLRADVTRLGQTLADLIAKQAQSARAQMKDAFGTASENISETAALARDRAESLEADVEARIQKNPWSAVAIALGVGILIGKLS